MRVLEALYRSPLGIAMSAVARAVAGLGRPFMVYGYRDPDTRSFRKFTRMSSNLVIMNPERLAIADHVWVWHHSILDATEGITIGEGAQIGAWVGVFTHGSEVAIRLLGRTYIHVPNKERIGYTRGPVRIGPYSFVGAGSVILPGVTVGRGCLVAAMSLVNKDVPDFSVVRGQPAKVIGDTRDLDARWLGRADFESTYYDEELIRDLRKRATSQASS